MATNTILTKGASVKPIQFAIAGLIVIGGGYFLLKKVGKDIIPTPEEKAKKDAEDVSVDNPFSFTQFLGQKIPAGTPMIKVATAQANAKQVYNALNTFFFDEPDMVIGLFNSYVNKVQVAQMCQAFYFAYKRDILNYLKNGNKTFDFGSGGLSDEDYNRVVTIVNKKSKF